MQLGEVTYGDIRLERLESIGGCEPTSEALQSCPLLGGLIASVFESRSLLYRGLAHEQLSLAVA